MAESASDLVAQLVRDGEWPEPELLERILALGDAAVEPLREVLRQDLGTRPPGKPIWFAAQLLCSLRASVAIPEIVDALRQHDPTEYDIAFGDLRLLGPAVVDALLEAADDEGLSARVRAVILASATEAATQDQSTRRRVESYLLARLQPLLKRARATRGETPPAEDQREVSSLLDNLYFLDHSRARAIARDAVAAGAINRETVEFIAETLKGVGQRLSQRGPTEWIADYRRELDDHRLEMRAKRRLILLDAGDFGREVGREEAERQLERRQKRAS